MPKIAVVILNWNGAHLLERFLPSVIEYSKDVDAEIIIADNASTDTSVAFIRKKHPEIRIVQNAQNGGFAKGYNDALQHIEADIYCLLNSDVEVSPRWLNPILDLMDQEPQIGIIQPKILDLKRKTHFEYAGAAGGFIDMLGYPYCRGRVFQVLEEDLGQYDDQYPIFWATGACMFIRSELFHQLQGFDSDYFAHQEEIDLCWRAQNIGHQVWYTGKSHIYHLGGSTLGNMNPKKTFLNFRNSLFSIVKNVPGHKVIFLVFVRLILDGIAGFRFVLQGKFKHCLAVIHAHFSFYRNAFSMIKKRQSPQYISNYYHSKSIVWSHFINNVKYFKFLVKD
ncbi:MAG: glycosyltransferase family 2 protein [Flavobacteriaceae bacterium]|nr:glycosyltransferase family 2 protein [Flavobacteriaceae bacterium]